MLLFIHIPAGLIVLIVILYLIGLAMSINNPDKSFFSVISRGLKGGGLLILALIVIGGGVMLYKNYSDPSAEIKISNIQRLKREGIDGLEVQIDGELENIKKGKVELALWFYFGEKEYSHHDNFPILKDFNNQYNTTDGQVSVGNTIEVGVRPFPSNRISSMGGSKLFIPIKELHLRENYKQNKEKYIRIPENGRIRMEVGAFYNGEQIGTSDARAFTVE